MSSDLLITPELARAWQNYFRFKGGVSPDVPREVVPVIVLDDNSKGPYPPCRHWHMGNTLGPSVGNYSYIAVANVDNAGTVKDSIVVVDRVFVRTTPAGLQQDYLVGVGKYGTPNIADGAVHDVILERDAPTTDPYLGNVTCGTAYNAAAFVAAVFPGATPGIVQEIPGPFILGPQEQLMVVSGVVNNTLAAYFRGRYYPAI